MKAFRAVMVLACFMALGWAGPLASGLPGSPPTLSEWAAQQPRQYAPDGREIPFSGTPYFRAYHPDYFKSEGGEGEGGASARWAPVLRVTGTHCYLYVDSAASPQPNDTVCANITDQFDTVIWPTDTGVFGTPVYSMMDIYIYPIDGGGGVGGYYSGGNDLYADSYDMDWMLEILAHEFQHLIHNSKDSNEDSWVNEGCADLAIQLCYGFGNNTTSLDSHIAYFEANPDNDLTVFQSQLYDYGSSYAFLSYFHEHFGGNATIKALVADTANGIQGFNNRLAGTGKTFTSIFRNWTVANYMNNESIADIYGYNNLTIKVGAVPIADYPYTRSTAVNRWAADYHVFTADGADLDLSFNGTDSVPFEVWLGKVGIGQVPSSVEKLTLDSARDGNISVPRLGMDYSEIVMVTSASTSGGSYCFTADAIDRTPPVTVLKVAPALPDTPDGWYTRPPALSLSANERRATIYYRWDEGGDTEYAAPLSAPEGEHLFRFHARDISGNVEVEREFSVRVDTTPPATNLTVAPPDGRAGWYVSAPNIALSSEEGARTLYRWEGQNETDYTGVFRPPEGLSSLSYRSVDRHGNIEENQSAGFRLDTQRPESTMITDPAAPDGENGWFLRPPVIRLETEPQGELYYRWDGGGELRYLLPLVAREGRQNLTYYAMDQAGNREEPKTFSVLVDSTAPQCSAELSPDAPDGSNGYFKSNLTIALFADADSAVIYRWNFGKWQNYTGPLRAPEGQSTLFYYALDGAGNRAQDQSLDVSVDTVLPVTVLLLEPDAGGDWMGQPPSVMLTSEPMARTFWSIDDGEPRQHSGRLQLPAGRHTLWYHSVDEAGNEEARRSNGYALDLSEPSGALACGNLTPLENQTITFDGSGSNDSGSGVRDFRFIFGDGTESGWVNGSVVSHAYARAGVYTASLTVRDGVGRESPPVSITIPVSAPPPRKRPAPPAPTFIERLGPVLPVLAVLVVAAAAGAALAMRRRKTPPAAPLPGPEVRWD